MSAARLLGRIWSGGHYCRGTPEFRKRAKRSEQRQIAREVRAEFDRYPSGYSPLTLLRGARHDTPDLTGELIDWRFSEDE